VEKKEWTDMFYQYTHLYHSTGNLMLRWLKDKEVVIFISRYSNDLNCDQNSVEFFWLIFKDEINKRRMCPLEGPFSNYY
jgi:hypothetical protein